MGKTAIAEGLAKRIVEVLHIDLAGPVSIRGKKEKKIRVSRSSMPVCVPGPDLLLFLDLRDYLLRSGITN